MAPDLCAAARSRDSSSAFANRSIARGMMPLSTVSFTWVAGGFGWRVIFRPHAGQAYRAASAGSITRLTLVRQRRHTK